MVARLDGMQIPRGTLLIVVDDATAAAACARVLRVEGYHVVTACGAEAGWRAFKAGRPDAILLDLGVRPADRVSFLRRLRTHQLVRPTPIAVMTTDCFVNDELDVELDALNAVVCFKPLWLEDVVRVTEQLLRG